MRLVFCKYNEKTQKLYFLTSLSKIRKKLNEDRKRNIVDFSESIATQDFHGKIDFMVADYRFAKTFKSRFSARWYGFWCTFNPDFLLADLDKLEAIDIE